MTPARMTLAFALTAFALPAAAQVVDVRQGTNISVAVDPSGTTLVVDLLGGLWRLPSTGGGATMLIAPGSGVSQPRFDPAGEHIVVERRHGEQWDLWSLDLASGTWTQLTDTPSAERHPDYLADGSGVVFASDRTGRYQLWLLDLRNDELRQLTDEPGESAFPVVANDATIAYANRADGESSLRVLARGPVGQTLATSPGLIESPSWRPGGHVLVYNEREPERSDLELLIDADTDVNRSLTENEDVFLGRVAWLGPGEFIYAADGQLWRRGIASQERRPVHMFAGVTVARRDAPSFRFQLDEAGPHPARGIRDFVRSPDGRQAVFAALGDLWLLRERSLERLTRDPAVDLEPRFVPGREEIVFVSDREGSFDLWRLPLATREPAPLTREPGTVSSPLPTTDGADLYFLSSADDGQGPARLMRIAYDGSAPATTVAGPVTGPVELSGADGRLVLAGAGVDPAEAQRLAQSTAAVLNVPGSGTPDTALDAFDALDWVAQTPAEPYVVQAGRLFDGVGNEYRRHVDIHVEGQRIVAIVGRNRRPLPERVIDFSEMTVIPGFIDVHAHHVRNTGRAIGLAWLMHGVTTVREVDADIAAALERSEAWASGARPGPRLYISPARPDGQPGEPAAGPIAISGASGLSDGFGHTLVYPSQFGHEPMTSVFDGGWNGAKIALSPLNAAYQDTLAVLAGSGSYLTTGLSAALQTVGEQAERRAIGRRLGALLQRTQRSFGRIAVGSDAPAVPYGYGFHMELEALVRAGVPNAQVLRWATAGGAMALGLDSQIGSLEAGRLADFVVIDGDPLLRITDTLNIEAVVKGGLFVAGPDSAEQRRPRNDD